MKNRMLLIDHFVSKTQIFLIKNNLPQKSHRPRLYHRPQWF